MCALLSGCFGSCSEGDGTSALGPIPPLPEVDGPLPRVAAILEGEEHEFTLRLTTDTVAPATGYSVEWFVNRVTTSGQAPNFELLGIDDSVSGVSTARIRATARGVVGAFARVQVCNGPESDARRSCDLLETDLARAIVWGGEAQSIVPHDDAIDLVVGEVRPVGGLALALRPADERSGPDTHTVSHEPVTLAAADPHVAEVDAAGLLRAVGPGETILDLRAGGTQASVSVRVSDGQMGPPPAGRHTAYHLSYETPDRWTRSVDGTLDDHLAVDSRGYPSVVFEPQPGFGVDPAYTLATWPLMVATWTGSGFGHQTVSDFWDRGAFPRMVIDDQDATWVVYFSDERQTLMVARRASANGIDWSTREIDLGQPLRADTSIMSRPGGGVFLSAVGYSAGDPPEIPEGCWRVTWLVELTEESEERQVVGLASASEFSGDCHPPGVREFDRVNQTWVVPGEPGQSSAARVLQWGPGETVDRWGWMVLHEKQAAEWSTRTLLPGPGVDISTYPPQLPAKAAVIRPAQTGGPTTLVWQSEIEQLGEIDTFTWVADLSGFDGLPTRPPFALRPAISAPRRLFALDAGTFHFVGIGHSGPLARVDSRGQVSWDDPLPVFYAASEPVDVFGLEHERASGLPWGIAGSGDRVHMAVDSIPPPSDDPGHPSLAYVVANVPSPVAADAAEEEGRRILDVPITPPPYQGPVVSGAGARYLPISFVDTRGESLYDLDGVASTPSQALLRSDGLDSSFAAVNESSVFWERPESLFVDGEDVVLLRRLLNQESDHVLLRSRNGGVTFEEELTFTLPGEIGAVLARPDGSLWLMTGGTGLEPATLARIPSLESPGAPEAVYTANGWGWSASTGVGAAGLVAMGDDVVLVFGNDAVRTARLASDGTLVSEHTGPMQEFGSVLARTTTRLADGALLVLGQWSVSEGYRLYALRSEDDFATAVRVEFEGLLASPLPSVLMLPDGRIAMFTVERQALAVHRAVVRTSTDGLTWSSPRLLRPDGGAGQSIAGVTLEPDGNVLIVMGDNESLRSFHTDEISLYYVEAEQVPFPHAPYDQFLALRLRPDLM